MDTIQTMPWYIFIHPVLQLFVIYLGIKNLNEGLNQQSRWKFNIHSHNTRGFYFAILAFFGAIGGWLTNQSLANPIQLKGHRFITYLIMLFIVLIVLSGLIKLKRSFRMRWLQSLHPWLGLLTVSLMFAQLFIVITKIIGW